jgi:hypothetical protein
MTAALLKAINSLQTALQGATALKKNPAKRRKKPATKPKRTLGAPSRATGKKPSQRLMQRRAKDTIPGYYPNPKRAAKPARKRNPTTKLQYVLEVGHYTDLSTAQKAAQLFADKHRVSVSIHTYRVAK